MLKTNVDKLLDILKQRKEVMISDLAAALNTTPNNIEKIAKLLEEEKLVTIRYKMMKPYLVYGFKERKKEKKKKVKKEEGKVPEVKSKKPLFVWKGKPISLSVPKLFKKKKIKEPKKPIGKLPELKKKPLPKKKQLFFKKSFPRLETKKSLFSFLKKKKKIKERTEKELEEVKEAIKKAKGIRLEKKPIKLPILKPKPFPRPIELKPSKKEKEIITEEDAEREINNLIKEIKKQKDKNLIKRNYKKALALYSKIKNTDAKIEYNKKLKDLYEKLTK